MKGKVHPADNLSRLGEAIVNKRKLVTLCVKRCSSSPSRTANRTCSMSAKTRKLGASEAAAATAKIKSTAAAAASSPAVALAQAAPAATAPPAAEAGQHACSQTTFSAGATYAVKAAAPPRTSLLNWGSFAIFTSPADCMRWRAAPAATRLQQCRGGENGHGRTQGALGDELGRRACARGAHNF